MNKILLGFVLCLIWQSPSVYAQMDVRKDLPGHASFSVLVRDLETGTNVYSVDHQKTLISASLMKLVTTGTALEILGPDFYFSTSFRTTGTIENGVVKGDLIIEGGGDPTLGSEYFPECGPDAVIRRVGEFFGDHGITRVEGDILLDESYLDGPRFPSFRLWEDMGNYYGAPPSALSWRDNSFELVLSSPSDVGELCSVVSVNPNSSGLSFKCMVRAASHNKDSAYIYGFPGLNEWEVRGSIPAGRDFFSIKGALPNPGVTFAREVAALLTENGYNEIRLAKNDGSKSKGKLIGELKSPSLSEIIRETNQHSINLAADHLLIALGSEVSDTLRSEWDNGLRVIEDHWKDKIANHYINIKDGSGLAPLNTLSSGFLVGMLDYLYQSPHFDIYEQSLARSGMSGTLKYMWQSEGLRGHIYGKSGSMQDVMGYAGYVLRPGKSPLAFAFMVNHHGMQNSDVRKRIETFLADGLKKW